MIHTSRLSVLALLIVALCAASASAYPKPNPYPISWEFKFEHSKPKRILVRPAGAQAPEAYWYMTYTVTNTGRDDQKFLPVFELLDADGNVHRSDRGVSPTVLEAIKVREKNPNLESVERIADVLRVGEDQAKDGVAIWKEPMVEMGRFTIFVGGLSGESTQLKDDKGEPLTRTTPDGKKTSITVWKTLQVEYLMLGDDQFPGNDPVEQVEKQWVMR